MSISGAELFSFVATGAVLVCATEMIDLLAIPRRRHRSVKTLPIRAAASLALFGLVLAASNALSIALIFTLCCALAFTIGSNIKYTTLGEPLVFSDFVVVRSFFLAPEFYLDAIPKILRYLIPVGLICLGAWLYELFHFNADETLIGMTCALVSSLVVVFCARRLIRTSLMNVPDLDHDVAAYGLIPVLIIYWMRWRRSASPPPLSPLPRAPTDKGPDIVIVVQCESFAELPIGGASFPGLAQTRQQAQAWGDLQVSGFGAYTMRTEYGVLCGREETALGFRRFDPFLTARTETSYALPHRLSQYLSRAIFIHPHDLRFYERHHLMPALGFDEMIGATAFPPPEPGTPYISDQALGKKLLSLAEAAQAPTLLYAITMENHGPWERNRAGQASPEQAWACHAMHDDSFLRDLVQGLEASQKDAVLVFYGDHRPSIPGISDPGPERHTPYVALRFPAHPARSGHNAPPAEPRTPVSHTPAQLHQLILDLITTQHAPVEQQ